MCVQDQEHNAASASPRRYDDPFPWHIGVFDAHNHVAERMHSASDLPDMKARAIAVMATRTQDQSFVADLVAAHGVKTPDCFSRDSTTVVAGYGRHPWFCHELYDDSSEDPTYVPSEDVEAAKGRHYKAVLTPSPEDPAFWHDLPTPMPLSTFISETRSRLQADSTAMVGEVGLDKPFRLPMQWQPEAKAVRDCARTPGGRERRPLSPHNIQMSHQKTVLMAHLRLAGELGRAVSVHGVQVHGVLYDFLTSSWKGHELKSRRAQQKQRKGQTEDDNNEEKQAKPYPPRICLHSFSGKSDAVKQYLRPSIPAQIYFSFSKTNNLSSDAARAKTEDAVKLVPDNRVLVESDIHTAGERMDSELEEMYRTICEIKSWDLEDGVSRIASNYKEFLFGQ
ncbi:Cut9-interacting protein scn1 [Neonectria magnoliae]|uniref:Cut9-interacting protein scn1 n=1 Tax=Neonectria magnoliae TaxID=2732573 RepID=A0ABR1I8K1_9HYPO